MSRAKIAGGTDRFTTHRLGGKPIIVKLFRPGSDHGTTPPIVD